MRAFIIIIAKCKSWQLLVHLPCRPNQSKFIACQATINKCSSLLGNHPTKWFAALLCGIYYGRPM